MEWLPMNKYCVHAKLEIILVVIKRLSNAAYYYILGR